MAGFEIAVHDAVRMRQLQRVAEPRHDALDIGDVETLPRRDFVLQARPVQELHHEKRVAGWIDIQVEDRHDVGVPQLRRGTALAHEALADRRHRGVRANDLDGDFVEEEGAPRAIDRAHTARGDDRDNLVAPVQDGARRKHGAI